MENVYNFRVDPPKKYKDEVKKTYYSNAKWSKIKDSQDEHRLKDTNEEKPRVRRDYLRSSLEKLGRTWSAV